MYQRFAIGRKGTCTRARQEEASKAEANNFLYRMHDDTSAWVGVFVLLLVWIGTF